MSFQETPLKQVFENKVILVTGGVGSIGSEIVRQLLKFSPKQIRVFDNRETELFHMQNELLDDRLRFLLGDIRDKDRLNYALKDVDIIFHAAALKHVPSCEYNPFEAVKTNVYGTQNVLDCSLSNNVEKVINISTDKVTNTINTMGATKLLAERLTIAAEYYKGNKRTIFSSVRFGNVLGSRGSILELFKQQIKQGGPITITNPDMTRFIMSISQAVNLVLKTALYMQRGELFILKMPVLRLGDLADAVIEEYSKKYNLPLSRIKKKIIGLRPGERMHEDLMTEEESNNALETDELFIVIPELNLPGFIKKKIEYSKSKKAIKLPYNSKEITPLTKEKLRDLLIKEGMINDYINFS